MERQRQLMMQKDEWYDDVGSFDSLGSPVNPKSIASASLRRSASIKATNATSPIAGPSSQRTPTVAAAQKSRAASPHSHFDKAPRITTLEWDVSEMCNIYSNFRPVRRVSALAPPPELFKALSDYEESGQPLIIEDWHKHPKWRTDIMSLEWLLADVGNKELLVRNVHDGCDLSMSLSEFVEFSRAQSVHSVPEESQRLYWKDADCPAQWREWVQEALPPQILPGCPDDLLRHLYPSEAVESLLCYLGIGDTYTPAHKDLCASSGHNLMCFSENSGSSFWFMTQEDEAYKASEYFQKTLGYELDWEHHVTTLEELRNAPFNIYVTEQKVGDLVLVPPRSVHQVVNRGGLTMKTSWSRMNVKNLEVALTSELPIYHRVCRPEQYRVKTMLYRSMLYYTEELQSILAHAQRPKVDVVDQNNPLTDSLAGYASSSSGSPGPGNTLTLPQPSQGDTSKKLRLLLNLFDTVLHEEYASCHTDLDHVLEHGSSSGWSLVSSASASRRLRLVPPFERNVQKDDERSASCNFACDFCGADIFQSFFECRTCRGVEDGHKPGLGDGLLLCPACYVEGRTCSCENMQPVQCRAFKVLLQDRNDAMEVLFHGLPQKQTATLTKVLQKSDFSKSKQMCIFEAACKLRNLRHAKSDGFRKCRSTTGKAHPVHALALRPCSTCHSARCYHHLLLLGTHCAEAILVNTADDSKWHDTHKNNTSMAKKRPLLHYKVFGDTQRKFTVAAISFPRCRPAHRNTKLGWYDEGNEYGIDSAAAAVNTEPHPPRLNMSYLPHTERDQMSPLTPVESSPDSSPKKKLPSDCSSQGRVVSISVPPAATLVEGTAEPRLIDVTLQGRHKAHTHEVWVEIPKMRKRVASFNFSETPASKKPRVSDKYGEELNVRRARSVSGPGSTIPRSSARDLFPSNDMDTSEDYAPGLRDALTKAAAPPVFTKPPREQPGSVLKRGARRVVDSDTEDTASPPRAMCVIYPPAPLSSAIVGPLSSSQPRDSADVSIGPPSQPYRITRELPRTRGVQNLLPNPKSMPSATPISIPPTTGPPTTSRPLPSRKRKGPPGVPTDQFPEHCERVAQNEARNSARKKAHLEPEPIVQDAEIIDGDSERRDAPMRPTSSASTTEFVALPPPPPVGPSLSSASGSGPSSSSRDPEASTPDVHQNSDTSVTLTQHADHPPPNDPKRVSPAPAPGPSEEPVLPDHVANFMAAVKKSHGEMANALQQYMSANPPTRRQSEENAELRAQVARLTAQNELVTAELGALRKDVNEIMSTLKKECSERHLMASTVHKLVEGAAAREGELDDKSKDKLRPVVEDLCRDKLGSIMVTLRRSMSEMVSKGLQDAMVGRTPAAPDVMPNGNCVRPLPQPLEDARQGHYPVSALHRPGANPGIQSRPDEQQSFPPPRYCNDRLPNYSHRGGHYTRSRGSENFSNHNHRPWSYTQQNHHQRYQNHDREHQPWRPPVIGRLSHVEKWPTPNPRTEGFNGQRHDDERAEKRRRTEHSYPPHRSPDRERGRTPARNPDDRDRRTASRSGSLAAAEARDRRSPLRQSDEERDRARDRDRDRDRDRANTANDDSRGSTAEMSVSVSPTETDRTSFDAHRSRSCVRQGSFTDRGTTPAGSSPRARRAEPHSADAPPHRSPSNSNSASSQRGGGEMAPRSHS